MIPPAVHPARVPTTRSASLRDLMMLFARLGVTAFGGPAAHIAMMEEEVVRRRGWLTRERFLDLLGATNLIPGPNSTEMAIHIGHHRAGWPGLVVAGSAFIVPATAITLACAWAYTRFGSLPQAAGVLYGVKPVIIAVVIQALWSLGRTAVKTTSLALVALVASLASVLGINELATLLGAGVAVAAAHLAKDWRASASPMAAWLATAGPLAHGSLAAAALPFSFTTLFLFFLKVGAILFGSGYVLLAFLRADLVDRWHWLTQAQLLDAIAIGQITPGPVFSAATFVGYLLGGASGALIATVGIFLPAFIFVAVSGPLVPRLRNSALAGAFLDGVNVGALALMAVVTWSLARVAIVDVTTLALVTASAFLLVRYRVNSAWLIVAGACIGFAMWVAGLGRVSS